MLRDSKLRFERISPVARAAVVAVVLVAGLLVAGLRGPGWPAQARAEEAAKTPVDGSTVAATNDANGPIDMSFVPAECRMFLAVRPADTVGRPEMAGWAELLDKLPNAAPKGKRLVDFRQITMVIPKPAIRVGPREVVVFQAVEPIAASVLMPPDGTELVVKEVDDRKMYVGADGRPAVLQYDDRTIVHAGTEQAIRTYLAGNLGTLPRWLAKETWEAYRDDHVVGAWNMDDFRDELEAIVENREFRRPAHIAQIQTILSTVAPLWRESTHLIAGLRVGDAVRVHATAAAKDEASAEVIEKTVDAARFLARNLLKELDKTTSERRAPHEQAWPFALLANPLDTLQISREGAVVRAEGSIGTATVKEIEKSVFSAAMLARSNHNLKTLGIAVLHYESAHLRFPSAVLLGPDGKTPHSWRVAILPYVGEGELYKQYRFDEPWDSPANRKVLEQMPDVYRSPTEPAGSTNACYFALTGPETVFDGQKGATIRDLRDGTTYTLLFVEAKRDIAWTKPQDIPYAADQPLPNLGGFFEGLCHVVFCDGSVRTLLDSIPEKTLRGMITKAGREVLWGSFDDGGEVKR